MNYRIVDDLDQMNLSDIMRNTGTCWKRLLLNDSMCSTMRRLRY